MKLLSREWSLRKVEGRRWEKWASWQCHLNTWTQLYLALPSFCLQCIASNSVWADVFYPPLNTCQTEGWSTWSQGWKLCINFYNRKWPSSLWWDSSRGIFRLTTFETNWFPCWKLWGLKFPLIAAKIHFPLFLIFRWRLENVSILIEGARAST